MTWDEERSKSGKRPWNWIEIEIKRCTRTYGDGVGTSPSTGCQGRLGVTGDDKCYNGWETCQDRDNFNAATYWLRICEASSDAPRSFEFLNVSPPDDGLPFFIPLLKRLKHDPTIPNPGESLGTRARLTVDLVDAPHHDIGIDKYALERVSGAASYGSPVGEGHNPVERSTLLRKLKARFPYYIGHRLRWYQGYITDSPSLADFRRRDYLLEKFEGPNADGVSRLLANDVLRMLDDDRAVAPAKSTGALMVALDASTLYTQIDVTTSNATEYDTAPSPSPSVGYVRIGDEVFTYTGTSAIANGVRLTGVTRAAPFPYSTDMTSHDVGDLVQLCHFFRGTVAQVVEELMVDFAGVDPAYIPTADWTAESDTWSPEPIERLITEPEGVRSIVDEIINQTLTWGFWFDEVEQEIKYSAVRPAGTSDVVQAINDDENLVADSVEVVDIPDLLVNELQVLYGQINPTGRDGDIENFRAGLLSISSDSQSENELGQRRIKKIFARWHPPENSAVVTQFATRTLNNRSKNLVEVRFKLERKDEDIGTASFCDLSTIYLVSALGLPRTVRMRVLSCNVAGEEVEYRAREEYFRFLIGTLAPELTGSSSPTEGLLYTEATESQRSTYMFLANEDGVFSNGDTGKALL